MINRLICFLLGHIYREQVFTGDQYDSTNILTGQSCKGNYYVWVDLEHCPRCRRNLNEIRQKETEAISKTG